MVERTAALAHRFDGHRHQQVHHGPEPAFGEPRYRGGNLGLAQRQIGERPQALAVLLARGALRAPLSICS